MMARDRNADGGGGGNDPATRSGSRRRSRRGRGGATGQAQKDGSSKIPNDGSGDTTAGAGGNRAQKGQTQSQRGNRKPSDGQRTGNHAHKGGGKGAGGKGPQGGRRNRKRRKPSHGGTGFWGDPAKLPAVHADIRITDEPAAVPRSLGPPPLPGHEQIAVHYFTAVYDRAVNTAGALAAAGGLIDPESLVGEQGEDR